MITEQFDLLKNMVARKEKEMKKIKVLAIAMMVIVLTLGVLTACGEREPETTPPETVYLAKDGATEYSVVWSDQGVVHSTSASRITGIINLDMAIEADSYEYTAKTTAKEILIGKTDRAISVELANAVDAAVAGDDVYAYGYGYKDGKLAYYANSAEALNYSWATFFMLLRSEDGALSCQSDLWVVEAITAQEYAAYVETTVPYYISYETNGGEILDEGKAVSYYYSKGAELPTRLTKTAYEFAGWYTNKDFRGSAITSISKDYQADLTLYAKWNKVAALIKYDLAGGTVVGEFDFPEVKADGTSITLPTLTKTYSTFLGWYDNPDFEGEPITEIPAAGIDDVTAYAKFDGPVANYAANKKTTVYFLENYNLGKALEAKNESKFTLHIDTASTGSAGWTDGVIRMRNGWDGEGGGFEIQVIKFASNKMTTYNGVELTAENSGAVVDLVVDIAGQTLTYYVDGVLVATESVSGIKTNLCVWNYASTPDQGYTFVRGNLFQLTSVGSRTLSYDFAAVFLGEWITAPATAE